MRRWFLPRLFLPWFAALLQVWLPVAGYVSMARAGELVEVCTPRGLERVAVDGAGLPGSGDRKVSATHHDHCPLCSAAPGIGVAVVQVAGPAPAFTGWTAVTPSTDTAGLQCRPPASTGPPSFS